MAEFIVDLFSTLDGFGTGPVGYWGKEGSELLAERARALGDPDQTLVVGANTYRLMQRFHTQSSDPGSSLLNKARKIVISRTLKATLTWMNSTLVTGDALDVVPRLKAESPVPLRCHGSIRMNRALLAAGLVDRLELMVFPVITGESGRNPVLAGLPDIDLELVDSRTFDGRVQQLTYIPKGPYQWAPGVGSWAIRQSADSQTRSPPDGLAHSLRQRCWPPCGRHGSCSCESHTSSGSSARTSRWPSVRGSSSSLKKTAVSPAMTTGRPPVSTTTTCEPGVCPGAGTSRSPRQQLELAVHGDVLHAGRLGRPIFAAPTALWHHLSWNGPLCLCYAAKCDCAGIPILGDC